MNLKNMCILIVLMLCLTSATSICGTSKKTITYTSKQNDSGSIYEPVSTDEIDQHNGDYSGYGGGTYTKFAQSFVPTKNTLSKMLIPIWKMGSPGDLIVSIRDELDGVDLTRITVNASQIGTDYQWYTFHFKNILFDVGETYYIVWIPSKIDDENNFFWGYGIDDPYPHGHAWAYQDEHWIIHQGWPEHEHFNIDFCFSQYGYDAQFNPDLYCTGNLQWNHIKPGDIVNGSFTVQNIGDSGSSLNWNIESYPEWGEWTFVPKNGVGLTPEDGSIVVKVFVTAPYEKAASFLGDILVINTDDSTDYETISVTLATTRNKVLSILFGRLLDNSLSILQILRYV